MPSTEASENNRVLNTFHLTMINIAIVFTVRGFPMLAEEGLSSLFFLFFAAATFFIPAALVAAELATGWPPKGPGGIYIWTREALGEGWGFVAVWFQWIANVVWFPSLLSFIAATIAYIFAPSLSDNKFFILSVVLVVFWVFTLANCRDMKTSGWISTAGVVCSFMVAGFIILLGVLWLTSGRTSQVAFEADKLLPDMTHIHNIVFLAGAMVILAGIELSGGHKEAVINPKRTFPRAILFSALISVVLLGLGTLAVAVVIPQKDISLVSGVMQLFEKLLDAYHIKWLVPWAAVLVVAGSIGEVSSWIAGLAKGLFVTARDGLLPPWLARENRQGVPVNVLIIQAVIVTVFSAVFLCMPQRERRLLAANGHERPTLPHHVHHHVCLGDRSPLQAAQHATGLPDQARQYRHMGRGGGGHSRGDLHPDHRFLPAEPDQDGQPAGLRIGSHRRAHRHEPAGTGDLPGQKGKLEDVKGLRHERDLLMATFSSISQSGCGGTGNRHPAWPHRDPGMPLSALHIRRCVPRYC